MFKFIKVTDEIDINNNETASETDGEIQVISTTDDEYITDLEIQTDEETTNLDDRIVTYKNKIGELKNENNNLKNENNYKEKIIIELDTKKETLEDKIISLESKNIKNTEVNKKNILLSSFLGFTSGIIFYNIISK